MLTLRARVQLLDEHDVSSTRCCLAPPAAWPATSPTWPAYDTRAVSLLYAARLLTGLGAQYSALRLTVSAETHGPVRLYELCWPALARQWNVKHGGALTEDAYYHTRSD